jgi:prevent-host-death family protein
VNMREFRAKLSELIREVWRTGEEIAITRRGVEIARLAPALGHKPTDEWPPASRLEASGP